MSQDSVRRRKPHPYDELRRMARSYWQRRIAEQRENLRREGKFPFEGGWHDEAEVVRRKAELEARNRAQLVDLALVFGVGILVLWSLFFLLNYLCFS